MARARVEDENRAASVAFVPIGEPRATDSTAAGTTHIRPSDACCSKLLDTVRELVLRRDAAAVRPVSRPRRPWAEGEAVVVHAVRTLAQLKECLRLRYDVYGEELDYLQSDVVSAAARVEMDCFDVRAIHFAAVHTPSGEVVGTSRLILPQLPQVWPADSCFGKIQEALEAYATWAREFARAAEEDVFLSRLDNPIFDPLPIRDSFPDSDAVQAACSNGDEVAELSRVIVARPFRGLWISTLLMRGAIVACHLLGRKRLVLECRPEHKKLYERHEFQLLEGTEGRVQGLRGEAIAMSLDLEGRDVLDKTYSMVLRNLDMINSVVRDPRLEFGCRHLCVCREEGCWKDGEYHLRTSPRCPLKPMHIRGSGRVGFQHG